MLRKRRYRIHPADVLVQKNAMRELELGVSMRDWARVHAALIQLTLGGVGTYRA